MDLKPLLLFMIDAQLGYAKMQLDMDAQLHALQITFLSLLSDQARLHAAQVLQESFEEQRRIRQEAFESFREQLSHMRTTVSTTVH